MNTSQVWNHCLEDALKTLQTFLSDSKLLEACHGFTEAVVETVRSGGNLFSCGNGGSHCDAMHFAEEWTGRFRGNRSPVGALALGDASHTTCVSNDFGFDQIFARQLEGLGRKGDFLLALSTSGNSKNVLAAVEVARKKGIRTVGLLGKTGGELKHRVDIPIVVPHSDSGRVQEIHIKLIHTVIESAERILFPENYRA